MRRKRLENKIISEEIFEEKPNKTDILILKESVQDKEIYLIFRKEEDIDEIGSVWRYMGPRDSAPYHGKRLEKMQRVEIVLCSELSDIYKSLEDSDLKAETLHA